MRDAGAYLLHLLKEIIKAMLRPFVRPLLERIRRVVQEEMVALHGEIGAARTETAVARTEATVAWAELAAIYGKTDTVLQKKALNKHLSGLTGPPLIVIATHHKGGTVWLWNIFREIAKCLKINIEMETYQKIYHRPNCIAANSFCDIFFQPFSVGINTIEMISVRFPGRCIKGLHLIRDPRDIVISGAYYHMKSEEQWLHEPNPDFKNMTYQEKINSLSSDFDRFVFEMDNFATSTIRQMANWDYHTNHFFELRYEDLVKDVDCMIFRSAFLHLGFTDSNLELAMQICSENSIANKNYLLLNSNHIRSGQTEQWRKYFTAELHEIFEKKFPGVIQKLSYPLWREA